MEDMSPEELPLADEVEELLLREQTLMSLKLLQQQKEAKIWKEKYDELTKKISSTEIQSDVDLGTLDDIINHNIWHTGIDEIPFLMESITKNLTADFSGKPLGVIGLRQILKGVHSLKKSRSIPALILGNCSLDESCSEDICAIFSMANIDAFDFSCNQLGDSFTKEFLKSLRFRKKFPQYILLHGNMDLTENSTLATVLGANNDRTWGLSFSCRDFFRTAYQRTQHSNNQTNKRDSMGNQQPMTCLRFLNAIEASIAPTSNSLTATSRGNARSSLNATSGIKATGSGDNHRTVPLSNLGLQYSNLSRQSIATLERVLHLSVSSLTDLDCTWCFLGVPGAEMLGRVLGSPRNCQIVRLGLQGNAFGDAGATAISKGLLGNSAITSLDLRSNDVTVTGLHSLITAICTNDPHSPLKSSCLFRLDVRGNNLSARDVQDATGRLRFHRKPTTLKWTYFTDINPEATMAAKYDSATRPELEPTSRFQYRDRVKVSLRRSALGGDLQNSTEALLFRLESQDLLASLFEEWTEDIEKEEDVHRKIWELSWKMRTVASSGNHRFDKKSLKMKTDVGWEIRICETSFNPDTNEYSEEIHEIAGSALHAPRLLCAQNERLMDWAICSVQVPASSMPLHLPESSQRDQRRSSHSRVSRLEVWAWGWREHEVEAIDFNVTSRNIKPGVTALEECGGDCDYWNGALNALMSIPSDSVALPEGHRACRHLSLPSLSSSEAAQGRKYTVSWEMCLGLLRQSLGISILAGSGPPSNSEVYLNCNYEWAVSLVDVNNGLSKVLQTQTFEMAQEGNEGKSDGNRIVERSRWEWRRWDVDLTPVAVMSSIIVSARVLPGASSPSSSSFCTVKCRRVRILESFSETLANSGACVVKWTPSENYDLFCVHNDHSIEWTM